MVLSSFWLPPKARLSECLLNLGILEHGLYHLRISQAQAKHNAYLDEYKTKFFCSVSQSVSSVAQSCPTLCDPMNHSTPGLLSITNSRSPPKPMCIETVMPSNHLILCRPLLMPSIFPSIRVFSDESALCIRWTKY